jgi:hypothetical protein
MSRSQPPGFADDGGDRASLYRAAVQQFEDLMTAASSTGPAASPLPLYYALNQAGRAVLAVRETDDEKVFVPREHHGLTIRHEDVVRFSGDLLAVPIRPPPQPKTKSSVKSKTPAKAEPERSHCRRVAEATSSPCLENEAGVRLGALLAALPEVTDGWRDDRWPVAVALHPLMDLTPPLGPLPSILPGLGGVMDAQSFNQGTLRVALASDAVQSEGDLATFVAAYPSLVGRGATLPLANARNERGRVVHMTPSGPGFELLLNVPPNSKALVEDHKAALDALAPEYRWIGRRWLRPAIEAQSPPPSPLITWWISLYAFSMFARYHPVAWTAALDLDSSPIAAVLERTLSLALEAVPHLIFEAVLSPGRPALFPPGPDTPPAQR